MASHTQGVRPELNTPARRRFGGCLRLPRGPRLALVAIALAGLAASPALAGSSAIKVAGVSNLKPLKFSACKSTTGHVNGTKETDVSCLDEGTFRGAPKLGGLSYAWLWRVRAKMKTLEVGNLTVNFGDGIVYLRLVGTVRTIGRTTQSAGAAETTGTWKIQKGTDRYKNRQASGTYTFDIKREGLRYQTLSLKLLGEIR